MKRKKFKDLVPGDKIYTIKRYTSVFIPPKIKTLIVKSIDNFPVIDLIWEGKDFGIKLTVLSFEDKDVFEQYYSNLFAVNQVFLSDCKNYLSSNLNCIKSKESDIIELLELHFNFLKITEELENNLECYEFRDL